MYRDAIPALMLIIIRFQFIMYMPYMNATAANCIISILTLLKVQNTAPTAPTLDQQPVQHDAPMRIVLSCFQ